MANKLTKESSLYLKQHQNNPVFWYPWGEEALEVAQQTQKLLIVSIGYSSCHWCHVMERESFENKEVALLMNEHFVSIKVDREERPDIDQIYMTAVQLMTQAGAGHSIVSVCLTVVLYTEVHILIQKIGKTYSYKFKICGKTPLKLLTITPKN